MSKKRACHSEQFKAKIALAAVRGDKTLGELAQQFQVHPTQISTWKQHLLDRVPELFADRRKKREQERISTDALYQQIGQLSMELSWLQKKTASFDGG
jgi:transposase-like protein